MTPGLDEWGALPYQRSTDVIGYIGGAELFCPPCARFTFDRVVGGVLCTITQGNAVDYDGITVTPLFRCGVAVDDCCAKCGETLVDADVDTPLR